MTHITSRIIQYTFTILGGLLTAFESTIDFFMPCLLAIALDVISAYFLGRRVHKLHPDKADGKFKSEYKMRVVWTMIIVFILLILACYVDLVVRKDNDTLAQRFAMGAFLFYEFWSCLENWSSENPNVFARALQRIMVNKAERHLNVPLSDIFGVEEEHPHRHHDHFGNGRNKRRVGAECESEEEDIEPIDNEEL